MFEANATLSHASQCIIRPIGSELYDREKNEHSAQFVCIVQMGGGGPPTRARKKVNILIESIIHEIECAHLFHATMQPEHFLGKSSAVSISIGWPPSLRPLTVAVNCVCNRGKKTKRRLLLL